MLAQLGCDVAAALTTPYSCSSSVEKSLHYSSENFLYFLFFFFFFFGIFFFFLLWVFFFLFGLFLFVGCLFSFDMFLLEDHELWCRLQTWLGSRIAVAVA